MIIARLAAELGNYCRKNPIGRALANASYNLTNDDQFEQTPSLSFITNEKGALVSEGAAPYMPDLAVEVQSPGQSDKFMVDKAAYYLANGSRMVWLVYPTQGIVEILTPKDRRLLNRDGMIEGGDVLPGFTFAVRDLFVE